MSTQRLAGAFARLSFLGYGSAHPAAGTIGPVAANATGNAGRGSTRRWAGALLVGLALSWIAAQPPGAHAGPLVTSWIAGGHADPASTVRVFGPDLVFTANRSFEAHVWSLADQRVRYSPMSPFGVASVTPTGVACSPDGKLLAVGDGYNVLILRACDGHLVAILDEHFSLISGMDFSPDGEWLVTTGSHDGQVILWRVADWSIERIQTPVYVESLLFSKDNTTFYGAGYGIRAWRTTDGALLRTMETPERVWRIALAPDGQTLLAACADGTIRRFDPATGAALEIYAEHGDEVLDVRFAPDGQFFVSASIDHTAKIWQLGNTTAVHTLTGMPGEVLSADFTPDGAQVIAGGGDYHDASLRTWDAATGASTGEWPCLPAEVSALTISAAGNVVVLGDRLANIHVLSAGDGAMLHTFADAYAVPDSGIAAHVHDLDVSPDGKVLVSCGTGAIAKLWSLETFAPIGALPEEAMEAQFLSDGATLVTLGQRAIHFWRTSDWMLTNTLTAGADNPDFIKLAASADGSVIAAGRADGDVTIHRGSDGMLLLTVSTESWTVRKLALAPAGDTVAAVGATDTLRLWRVSDGALLAGPFDYSFFLGGLVFAPDGRTIMSGVDAGLVRVRRVQDGAILRDYVHPVGGRADFLALSEDGQQLAFARAGLDVGVVNLPPVCGGDIDADGDVDADDFALFHGCVAGPGETNAPAGCPGDRFERADLSGDGDVDLDDFSALAAILEH